MFQNVAFEMVQVSQKVSQMFAVWMVADKSSTHWLKLQMYPFDMVHHMGNPAELE